MNAIQIGTSGWSYPGKPPKGWDGVVYPAGMKNSKKLDFYTKLFTTCELNTSFYQIPRPEFVRSWHRRTPDDFTFSVKIYKGITHDAKLNFYKIGNDLNTFMNRMKSLDDKITSYLLQLPPSFSKDIGQHEQDLTTFLQFWERNWPPEKLVVEFRHLSWIKDGHLHPDTYSLLKDYEATYCIVAEPLLPPALDLTNPRKAYVRLHGYGEKIWFNYNFSPKQLTDWAGNVTFIQEKLKKNAKTNVYFNNHFSGYAVKNAMDLMNFLDQHVPDLSKVQDRYSPNKGQETLGKFL